MLAEQIVRDLFFTPAGRANPYPDYHRLRATAPIHRSTSLNAWLLSRYDDGWAVLRDPRLGRDFAREMANRHGIEWRRHRTLAAREHSLLNLEGAAHTRLRRLVSKAFTPRTIEQLKPRIAASVEELLDGLAEAGGGDFLDRVAFPLPVTVIGELLGVPEGDRAQFRGLVRDLVAIFEMRPSEADFAAADAADTAINQYFETLLAEKRRRPDDALLSRLALAEDGGDRLTDQELISLASLLFGAGFETTTNLLGNGLLGLFKHPEALAALRAEPQLFANLADELLRYDGTVQMSSRTAQVEVTLGDVTIAPGDTVLVLLGAGNHDPARYPDPDRLDVRRTEIQPLSFGGGVHFCLGAALARAETEIALRCLLQRFPVLELGGEAVFRDRLTLRGLHGLPIVCATTEKRLRPAAATSSSAADGAPPLAPEPRPLATGPRPLAAAPRPLTLRPPATGTPADVSWRERLRAGVESEGRGFPASRAGLELAATAALLARNAFFRSCTPMELADLAATAYPIGFDPGELLCAEGGEALECYAIADGEATVEIGGKVIRRVGPDDMVGERGPLEGRTRSATVRAETHMVTYAISRQRLTAMVNRSASAAAGMRAYIAERYAD